MREVYADIRGGCAAIRLTHSKERSPGLYADFEDVILYCNGDEAASPVKLDGQTTWTPSYNVISDGRIRALEFLAGVCNGEDAELGTSLFALLRERHQAYLRTLERLTRVEVEIRGLKAAISDARAALERPTL